MTDCATLVATLRGFAERASRGPLSLGEVSDSLGGSSFSILCIILCLPFLSPVSLGPLATVGGLTLAALGWQLARGHPAPCLPAGIRRIEMSPQVWRGLIQACLRIIGWFGRISRRRQRQRLVGRRGARALGAAIIAAGLLMAVPLFGLPLNNMLPALAIIVLCLAELEDDGLMVFAGLGLVGVSAVYILGVLLVVVVLGEHALQALR